jgi:hypothetical protein
MAVVSPLHDTAVRAAHIGAAAAPRLGGSIGCTDYGSDGRHRHHDDHKLLHEHPPFARSEIRAKSPAGAGLKSQNWKGSTLTG